MGRPNLWYLEVCVLGGAARGLLHGCVTPPGAIWCFPLCCSLFIRREELRMEARGEDGERKSATQPNTSFIQLTGIVLYYRSLKIQMKVPGWVIHGKFTVHQREPSQTIARNLAGTRLLGWMASGHTPPELPGRGSLGAQCPEVWQESGGSGGVG